MRSQDYEFVRLLAPANFSDDIFGIARSVILFGMSRWTFTG